MSWLLALLACAPVEPADTAGPAGVPLPRDDVEGEPTDEDPMDWLEPHWVETMEICQPPDPFVMLSAYSGRNHMTEECVAQVGRDLGIPTEQLDDYRLSYFLLSSAFFLMGYPLGTVDELLARADDDGNHYIREPFRTMVADVADALGHDQVAGVLYDMVASVIVSSSVEVLEDAEANFNMSSRHLKFSEECDWTGLVGASILVHEAAHGWTGLGHIECPDGTQPPGRDWSGQDACDQSWDGAYGMQAGAVLLLQESIPPEEEDFAADWYWREAEDWLGYVDVHVLAD